MAEEKAPKPDVFEELVFLFAGLALLGAVLMRIENYIDRLQTGGYGSSVYNFFTDFLIPFSRSVLLILGVFAIVGIYYVVGKLREINIEERQIYGSPKKVQVWGEKLEPAKNDKWERILTLINSNNPSEWRHAILEADVMLDTLLRSGGYHGESTGEMLKAVERSDMLTLDAAWEAHKIRNKIAHEAGDFRLNEREARHAIALYESVFQEFQMI